MADDTDRGTPSFNRTIDSQVDEATGTPRNTAEPYPTGTPIVDAQTPGGRLDRGTHNPDNQLQGGPSMFHALRGFAKAYSE